MISIKYQLKSTRPTLINLASVLAFSCGVFVYPLLRPSPEAIIFFFGGILFLGAFLVLLHRYIVRQIPSEIETSGQLVVKYENGKTDRIPYNKIFSCAVVGTREGPLDQVFTFFIGPPLQLIVEVKPARIFPMRERKLAEQICEDIISKIPKEEPDLSLHPHP